MVHCRHQVMDRIVYVNIIFHTQGEILSCLVQPQPLLKPCLWIDPNKLQRSHYCWPEGFLLFQLPGDHRRQRKYLKFSLETGPLPPLTKVSPATYVPKLWETYLFSSLWPNCAKVEWTILIDVQMWTQKSISGQLVSVGFLSNERSLFHFKAYQKGIINISAWIIIF